MKDGNLSLFMGLKNFTIKADNFLDKFQSGNIPNHVLDSLPKNIKQSLLNGERQIPLDNERLSVFYYKKDDWRQWANPMIYAILDDIIMLEKMRLADLSALDGAISNIRLWTLGNLEYKILPNKAAINKLRDILASNVGGGTMELVWGPELSFTESSSEVYKFLGSEKYTSVLNSIYAGLGVPPTLTGMATNGGGFTNNFISLKTLVERLQYGRDQLAQFWEKEIEIVRKAMGFRYKAHIQFDQMTLSDEAAEKNLLIQLADRDIISHETLIERFKEIPDIERKRLKREMERRDTVGPPKARPFHNANQQFELKKIDKQAKVAKQNAPKPPNPNGRPLLKQDTNVRKKRVDKPKSKPGVAELLVWAENTMTSIATIITDPYLNSLQKSNLRQLTKSEVKKLEKIKLDIFTNVNPLSSVSNEDIVCILKSNAKTPDKFNKMLKTSGISLDKLSLENYKNSVLGKYIEYVSQN